MYIQEPLIASGSEYYIYSPGRLARSLYFCPLSAGCYSYSPGYAVSRNQFDSYLLMYIEEGRCEIENGAFSGRGNAGEFVFLDCYQPHSYRSGDGWKALWLHFDGPLAKTYFQEISARKGQIFSLSDPSALLSLEMLASKAGLSPYYFLRLFASETGFTPHQYLINTRINAAKFLLRSPDIPVKDISVRTGFTSESTFCTCFKKNEGMTPGQYRSSVLNRQESSPL